MILKLSPKEKYESIGMEIRVKTIDGKIFDGQVDAFNIAQNSIGLKDVNIDSENGKRHVPAAIIFERDIEHAEFLSKDGSSSNTSSNELRNKEKAGQVMAKQSRFRTDYEYRRPESFEEAGDDHLQPWRDDPDHPESLKNVEIDQNEVQGWSVENMYVRNEELGVKSSFVGIHTYSTAVPVGGDEERKRAHLLAAEIEKNEESKRNARMENMDEERDIVTHRKQDKKVNVRAPKRQSEVHKKRGQREQPQPVREEGNWRSKMATSEELSKYELDFQANLNRKLQAGSKSSYFI